jgi:hypothetical protein
MSSTRNSPGSCFAPIAHFFYSGRVELAKAPGFATYYRTPSGVEVDFIIETARRTSTTPAHIAAIEVKRADKWSRVWEKPLRSLAALSSIKTDRLIVVYNGKRSYRFDAIDVMPVELFFEALYRGEIF